MHNAFLEKLHYERVLLFAEPLGVGFFLSGFSFVW